MSEPTLPEDLNAGMVAALAKLIGSITGLVAPPANAFPPEWHAALSDFYRTASEIAAENLASKAAPTAVAFDMLAHLQRQRVFSERTFGPGKRTKMVADHIRKELDEVEENPSDLAEWVDVILLALDGAWRSGASPAQIVAGIEAKQTKNEGRTWPDWQTADPNKAIEHNRALDETPISIPQTATDAARDVLAERQRQVSVEGWTADHDDELDGGEIAAAAAAYALRAADNLHPQSNGDGDYADGTPPDMWPWHEDWWKPATPRRDLVKAGALILAEIERLDRASIAGCRFE